MTLDEAERQAHDALYALRHEYELRAKPFIEQLVRIHNLRPLPPFIVTAEQLAALGIVSPELPNNQDSPSGYAANVPEEL
jgi:hypothetical protein